MTRPEKKPHRYHDRKIKIEPVIDAEFIINF
jgi:hypothetical protein